MPKLIVKSEKENLSIKVLSDLSRQNKNPNKILVDYNYYNNIIITIFHIKKILKQKDKTAIFMKNK